MFGMRSAEDERVLCWRCAFRDIRTLRRSLLASALVGSIILAINQGDLLLSGQWSSTFAWKIPLSYLTPFVVATWGALSNARR